MDAENKGKTLWEMLMVRLNKTNGAGIAFANPEDLRIGSAVNVPYSNGADLAEYAFSVQEIREYNRHIGNQEFRFTDYVLKGVNTRAFDAESALAARLRAVPNQAGSHDTLFLRLYDEFGFAEEFLEVVKDASGIFDTDDEKTGTKQSYTRINDLKDSYQAVVLVVKETTVDGKAATGKTSGQKIEYWDYWRDVELAAGKTAKEFVFVEMNSDTGWFQIWRGREFFA